MIGQFDSIFDSESTEEAASTPAAAPVHPAPEIGTVASKAKSSVLTKGLKLTVPVGAIEAHEVLHAWAEALRRNPALSIPSPADVAAGTWAPVAGAPAMEPDHSPFDVPMIGTDQASEIEFLRGENLRLQEDLGITRDSLTDAQIQLASVPAGQLEILAAELSDARRTASQARRAAEIQAANHGVVVSRLKAAVGAYKAEVDRLLARAKFGTAVYRILERLPGHTLDPRTKILKGPEEVEILRYLDLANQAAPEGAARFQDFITSAIQPSAPVRQWYQFFKPRLPGRQRYRK